MQLQRRSGCATDPREETKGFDLMPDVGRELKWCTTHCEPAWAYGDESLQCMWALIVESSFAQCEIVDLPQLAILREGVSRAMKSLPEDIIAITARLAVVTIFWRSAQTKISGWEFLGQKWQFYNLNDSTFMLFEYEYGLPLLNHTIAAYFATFSEFFLSLAMLVGLMTRLSALALLGMTAVIQFLVYPDAWPTHIIWAAILLYIIKHGPGSLSLDRLFKNN